jgi:multiple sugar transport system permease protein/putative aldouronate transport system permease protein
MALTPNTNTQALGSADTVPLPSTIAMPVQRGRLERHWRAFRGSLQLYAMLFLPLLWLLVFAYIPMYGAQIAFRNYNVVDGITGSPWAGLDHFQRFIDSYNFWPIMKNTLVLNVYQLIAGFFPPIMLALALNYVMRGWFKKTVQMVTYAPHFISTVVMVGIILQMLSPTGGLVNQLLGVIGIGPINFMGEPSYWKSIYVWSGVWQNAGFNCIIFLAALAGIDPTLHEAAVVDGANKLQRIRDIDIPGILPVAVILLILNMGTLLSTGFEKVLLLQNPLNLPTSEVLDTYVYRVGLVSQVPNFSYAAAIGLFKSVIGLILILAANQLARRLKAQALW